MIYQITFKNNLRVLRGVLIFHLVFIPAYLYAVYQFGNNDGVFDMVFSIFYAVAMVPTLFLHTEYYLRNRKQIVEIDPVKKAIILNKSRIIQYDEITGITLFMAPVWHKNAGNSRWPFDNYRYAKIQMKNGEEYIMTCLMEFDIAGLMTAIGGVLIEKKVRLFASPLIN